MNGIRMAWTPFPNGWRWSKAMACDVSHAFGDMA